MFVVLAVVLVAAAARGEMDEKEGEEEALVRDRCCARSYRCGVLGKLADLDTRGFR